jgi:hypothetical protein
MTNSSQDSEQQATLYSRLRRLVLFQIKLAADALRDLLLSPVAFICTFIDIICNTQDKNSAFERLMRFGRRSDFFINLFEQRHRLKESSNIEQVASNIESIIKNEMQNQTLSTKAKQKIKQQLSPKKGSKR